MPEADGVGADRYRVASRLALGDTVDPVEAYEWGWDELYRLEAEIDVEQHAIKPGADHDEIVALLDEASSVDSPEAYREWLQQQHDEAIESLNKGIEVAKDDLQLLVRRPMPAPRRGT